MKVNEQVWVRFYNNLALLLHNYVTSLCFFS